MSGISTTHHSLSGSTSIELAIQNAATSASFPFHMHVQDHFATMYAVDLFIFFLVCHSSFTYNFSDMVKGTARS